MIRFHVPPFAVDGGYSVVGEVGITADHIEDADAIISVYEDLLDQLERKINALQINGQGRIRFQK